MILEKNYLYNIQSNNTFILVNKLNYSLLAKNKCLNSNLDAKL